MTKIQLNQFKVTQAHIVNRVTPGKNLELSLSQSHTVSRDLGPNLCNVSSSIKIERKDADLAEPLLIEMDMQAIFSITASISEKDLFEETAQYLRPYIQSSLNQLVIITGLPLIEIPMNSTPTYPQ